MLLYDMPHQAPSPITHLHRAIAVRYAVGRRAVMAELGRLGELRDEGHHDQTMRQ